MLDAPLESPDVWVRVRARECPVGFGRETRVSHLVARTEFGDGVGHFGRVTVVVVAVVLAGHVVAHARGVAGPLARGGLVLGEVVAVDVLAGVAGFLLAAWSASTAKWCGEAYMIFLRVFMLAGISGALLANV